MRDAHVVETEPARELEIVGERRGVTEEADGGRPTVVAAPDSARAKAYFDMARRTAGALSRRARDRSSVFPKIVVEES